MAATPELFITLASSQTPILLVDASGSTVLTKFDGVDVIDQIKEVIKKLPEDQFRIIFWNSTNVKEDAPDDKFTTGVYRLPFVVKKNTLDHTFTHVKPSIKPNCLTFPHLGFNSIPDDWISKMDQTKIYFITDGEIGYGSITQYELGKLKTDLSQSITNLCTKHSKIQLNIITVEPKHRDFNQIETLTSAAGCDVYKVIMDNRLTKYITKFTSYTPNNLDGFVHINKNIPPKGFIPYGDKCFSELRVTEFIHFMIETVSNVRDNDDQLLKIVQMLSSTLCELTRDKPLHIRNDIINTFCGLFNGTSLDIMFVRFIITEAIQKESDGTANVFAAYRAKLKDLYKQATELLLSNVKEAVNINECFMTLPIKSSSGKTKIITGHHRLIDKQLVVTHKVYPQSAIKIRDITLPVLPYITHSSSPMNEQCLRQWTRLLIGKMYNLSVMEDIIIYVVLGIVLQVVVSSVPDTVKDAYRRLGHVMLRKKRMNSDRTELERLEGGELPIPNSGKIEGFYRFMDVVNEQLGFKFNSMTTWYILCLALDNQHLINNQLVHCKDSIEKDFPGIGLSEAGCRNLLLNVKKMMDTNIDHIDMPHEMVLDYNCLITLENLEKVGGYQFLPHTNMSGVVCNPVYILSDDGYNALISSTSVCPICYSHLTAESFTKIGPKPDINIDDILDADTINVFEEKYAAPKIMTGSVYSSSSSGLSSSSSSSSYIPKKSVSLVVKVAPKEHSMLVIMKGVVGAGKTTFSERLKAECEKMGKICFVEGVDKYCKNGDSMENAISKIKENLMTINNLDNTANVVVCIDTCGEHTNNKTNEIFGINFAGWKRMNIWVNLDRGHLENYLAWTLRNVLYRTQVTADCNYWLNPEGASVSKCIEVHTKKAKALFGKKVPQFFYSTPNRDDAIKLLNPKADEYAQYLAQDKSADIDIQKILEN